MYLLCRRHVHTLTEQQFVVTVRGRLVTPRFIFLCLLLLCRSLPPVSAFCWRRPVTIADSDVKRASTKSPMRPQSASTSASIASTLLRSPHHYSSASSVPSSPPPQAPRLYSSIRKPSMTIGASNGKRGGGNTEFNYPMAVAVGKHGNLFVVDHGNNRIQVCVWLLSLWRMEVFAFSWHGLCGSSSRANYGRLHTNVVEWA